jgi:hypothetical protein
LLDFNRPEVGVAAAWSLKKLALSETLPPMFEKARRNAELCKKLGWPPRGVDEQTGHLFEAFGRTKFAAAEPLLRQHVPKDFALGIRARSAAIWSLGLLHQGVPDESLARQLMERIQDNGIPPEVFEIKQACVVSLARMKATSQVAALRKLIDPVAPGDRMGMTVRWAVTELTGEQIPEPPPHKIRSIFSFLQSLDD